MPEQKSSSLKTTLIVSCLLIPVALLILYGMGSVNGTEFSPDDFARRSFSYNRIPGINWTIHGKKYFDYPPSNLEQSLITSGMVPVVVNNPTVWHLTVDSGDQFNRPSHDCDARFLIDYMELRADDGQAYWEKWNDDHIQCSKILWPIVAEMARDEMYLAIPDLMRLAMRQQKDDPAAFAKKVDQLVAQLYDDMSQIATTNNQTQRATDLLAKSKDYQDGIRPQVDEVLWEKYLATLATEAEPETEAED